LEDLSIVGRIILKSIKENGCRLDTSGVDYGPVADCSEHGCENSGFMKKRGFFD
jgi:hypothetical protein